MRTNKTLEGSCCAIVYSKDEMSLWKLRKIAVLGWRFQEGKIISEQKYLPICHYAWHAKYLLNRYFKSENREPEQHKTDGLHSWIQFKNQSKVGTWRLTTMLAMLLLLQMHFYIRFRGVEFSGLEIRWDSLLLKIRFRNGNILLDRIVRHMHNQWSSWLEFFFCIATIRPYPIPVGLS